MAGRPAFEPTKEQRTIVEMLAGFAIPQAKIAQAIGVAENTLAKHFAEELSRGAATVEMQLTANLLRIAKGSDGTALKAIMFALQCRFGWSQYAPKPTEAKPEPIGKKAAAEAEAQTAHKESEWGSLLN